MSTNTEEDPQPGPQRHGDGLVGGRRPSGGLADGRLITARFLLLLTVQLAFGFSFSTFFLLPKYLKVDLHLGPELIGRITALAGLASVLSVPFVAALIDRGSRRRLIRIGTTVSALAALGFGWVDHVGPLVFLLRVLQGASFTLVFNSVSTLAADQAPARRLGQTIGIVGVAAVCMNAIAPSIAEPLAEHVGWRAVFAASAGAALLAGLLASFLRERTREASPISFRHLVSARNFGVFHVVAIAGGAFGTLFTFIPPFALDLGARRVSTFFVAYTLAVIFVRMAFGGLADRWGRQRVATVALALYAVATLAAAALRPGLLVFVGATFGVAHGLFYPALNAFAVERSSAEERGSLMTFFNGAFNAGFSIGVIGLGALAQSSGYSAAFVAMGLVVAGGVVTLAFVPAARTESEEALVVVEPAEPESSRRHAA